MTTNDLIREALKGNKTDIVIYWDKQVPGEHGPAFRREATQESGTLEFVKWDAEDPRNAASDVVERYYLEAYFLVPDGAYLRPDQHGVYPILSPV